MEKHSVIIRKKKNFYLYKTKILPKFLGKNKIEGPSRPLYKGLKGGDEYGSLLGVADHITYDYTNLY